MPEGREILDFLRANFARLNERLDRVDVRLDELTTRIGALERDVASLSLRIAELKVDFSAIQSRLDTMDRRIERAPEAGRRRNAVLISVVSAAPAPAGRVVFSAGFDSRFAGWGLLAFAERRFRLEPVDQKMCCLA